GHAFTTPKSNKLAAGFIPAPCDKPFLGEDNDPTRSTRRSRNPKTPGLRPRCYTRIRESVNWRRKPPGQVVRPASPALRLVQEGVVPPVLRVLRSPPQRMRVPRLWPLGHRS